MVSSALPQVWGRAELTLKLAKEESEGQTSP